MLLLGWSIGFLVVICRATKDDSQIDLIKRDTNPCHSNTCYYGGKCKPNGNSFTCECPYPTGGKDCIEELKQCNFCFRYKKQVIYLLTKKNLNFEDSDKECKSLNLTMFMPSTDDEFLEVRDYMQYKEMWFGEGIPGRHVFWIGGKRASNGAPFLRKDNGKAVSYFNWAKEKPDGGDSNCMEMAGGPKFKFHMDNDGCENTRIYHDYAYWNYHPACSGTYEFFKHLN